MRLQRHLMLIVLGLGLAACGSSQPESTGFNLPSNLTRPQREHDTTPVMGEAPEEVTGEEAPLGRLPSDIQPLHYTLALTVVPEHERFAGHARIQVELTRPRSVIWLHGNGLNVVSVGVIPDGAEEPIEATWEAVPDSEGVAAIRLPAALPVGEATIEVRYDAPFDRQLKGLYKVESGGESYAFTQFEATSARLAFPCFDEPAFKTPFDTTMVVKQEHQVATNTPIESTTLVSGGLKRVRFATSQPMPTYLVAFAVGALDIVEAPPIAPNDVRSRPLPFRGIAVKGKGEQLAHALAGTPALLAELERYFGIEYPYAKLDIVAVPDFASGAMENAGLITFREQLLLLGEDAPEGQKRGFSYVMAHELAHQWFGNLVTMPWWDDIWLNEAFATWMGYRVVENVSPEQKAELSMLSRVHWAMGVDSQVSARQIRQPIESNHDIRNAFDAITYSKGGGVLGMVETWIGKDVFQAGLRNYMGQHRWRTATYEDLLRAFDEAAQRDVSTAFRTFLFQPGVPLVETQLSCEGETAEIRFKQSRYLPAGSTGDTARTWQIPLCVRHPAPPAPEPAEGEEAAEGDAAEEAPTTATTCMLLTESEGTMALPACPAWYAPNANGAGYFRVSMAEEDLTKVMSDGWDELSGRERMAIADGIGAAFGSGAVPANQLFRTFPQLARDETRAVATAPMSMLRAVRDRFMPESQRIRLLRHVRRLYRARQRQLGWEAQEGEDGETQLLRRELIKLFVTVANERPVRRDAARKGRAYVGYRGDGELHPEVVDSNLIGLCLATAVQESDQRFFDYLLERTLTSDNAMFRSAGLSALGEARDPALAQRARELSLDPRVRVNEVTRLLWPQMMMQETREDAWTWMQENFDRIAERIATTRAGGLPRMTSAFCTEERAQEVDAFFGPKVAALPGGPRNLAGALERIRLCASLVEAQGEHVKAFYSY